jgi:hypothetical protein
MRQVESAVEYSTETAKNPEKYSFEIGLLSIAEAMEQVGHKSSLREQGMFAVFGLSACVPNRRQITGLHC